jgi:hypothetical protein
MVNYALYTVIPRKSIQVAHFGCHLDSFIFPQTRHSKQHSTIMLTSAQIKSLVYASLTEPQQEAVEQSYAVMKGLLATAISMTPTNWSPSSP